MDFGMEFVLLHGQMFVICATRWTVSALVRTSRLFLVSVSSGT